MPFEWALDGFDRLAQHRSVDAVFHPAMAAIAMDDMAALTELLQADPELCRRRSSCSHPSLLQFVACEAQNLPDPLSAVRVLVEAGAPTAEPLVAAASVDAREVLLLLLGEGANIDGPSTWGPLDEALYWRHRTLAELLQRRGATVRSLRAAAGLGLPVDSYFVDGKLVAEAGPIGSPFADTVPDERANDAQDVLNNAFVTAVNNGRKGAAQALLERGAQVDAKPPGFHWRGTALHAAVWHGDEALVSWLLDNDADPTVRDDHVGADAAGWAKHHGHSDIASLLHSRFQ